MTDFSDLENAAQPVADFLRGRDEVHVVGQYDADGISATAILVEALERRGLNVSFEILKQLYEEDVDEIASSGHSAVLFVDVGSGQAEALSEGFKADEVAVVDHHEPETEAEFPHFNPHFLDVDGGSQISAAGSAFIVADLLGENGDLVDWALVGATGDIQKEDGVFQGFNERLVEKALDRGLVTEEKGLDLYGRTTKPLHRSLMYTSDPYLDGITDSESGATQFLRSAEIDMRENGGFRTLDDLSDAEEKRLTSQLIARGYDVSELVRPIHKNSDGITLDELSTVVNACGRLGEPEKGVEILRTEGDSMKDRVLSKYGRRISSAMGFVEDNPSRLSLSDGVGVIDADSEVGEEFIGVVVGICMGSETLREADVAAGLAEAEDGVKVSCRARSSLVESGLDLGEVVSGIAEELDAEGGGHGAAAGAMLPEGASDEFVSMFRERTATYT